MNEIAFVEVDAKNTENNLINEFQTATGEILYPGDERRIFLLQQVPVLLGLQNNINYTGNQNLLPYAVDKALDALGQFAGVNRLPAQEALVTLKFILSEAQLDNITIPAGTRATPDDIIYFSTLVDLIIAPGQIEGTVKAKSTLAGENYNGFIPGQIKEIVDPVPYVANVINIDTSYDGADIESNESYRERIQIAPEGYSVAGPSGGYVYWAKTADSNIEDVAVTSTSPGVVNLHILLKDGALPTQDILDKVYAIVNARDKRPLTDNVYVYAATVQTYDIDLVYYISKSKQSSEKVIRALIEDSGGVIDQYIKWQYKELGRAVTPDYLLSLLYTAGAFRVVINAPIYNTLLENEVAILNTRSVTYGGLI